MQAGQREKQRLLETKALSRQGGQGKELKSSQRRTQARHDKHGSAFIMTVTTHELGGTMPLGECGVQSAVPSLEWS